MRLRLCRLLAVAGFVSCFLASTQTFAQLAYITNEGSNDVSVIDTNKSPAMCEVAHTCSGIGKLSYRWFCSRLRLGACVLWRAPCRGPIYGTTACRGPSSTSARARRAFGLSG